MTIALAIASGLLIGLSLGALGGGGSILAVPALVYLLRQSPHQATTVSLIVVGIASLFGAMAHARAGRVRLKEGAIFGVLGIAGSYVGSLLSEAVPADILLAGFGVLMLVVAGAMTLRARAKPQVSQVTVAEGSGLAPTVRRGEDAGSAAGVQAAADRVAGEPSGDAATSGPSDADAAEPGAPGPDQRAHRGRHPLLLVAAASGVGLITGFFGVGGGFVVVPALVLFLGFDMPVAAGTSLVVIAIDSAAALASRATTHGGGLALDLPVTLVFTAAAVAGALAGGRVAGRVSSARLNTAFSILIVLLGIYTLARSLAGLL